MEPGHVHTRHCRFGKPWRSSLLECDQDHRLESCLGQLDEACSWGRPDMALFKFTKGILNKKKIDIYNHGKMYRDFTYVDDIVDGINALINKAPNLKQLGKIKNDSFVLMAQQLDRKSMSVL